MKSTTDEIMDLTRGLSDRDLKILFIVVHLMAHDPKAKAMPVADLWEKVSGEKVGAETRARVDEAAARRLAGRAA